MSRARSFSKLCHGGKTALFISIPCAWNEMFFMSHWWCFHNLVGKGSTWHATPPVFPQKKVSEKKLHFLCQAKKTLIKPNLFRCRIGCRILFSRGIILHQQHRFGWLHALLCMICCRKWEGKARHTQPYLSTIEAANTTEPLWMFCRWAIEETLNSWAVLCCVRHGIIRKCRMLRPQKWRKQGE